MKGHYGHDVPISYEKAEIQKEAMLIKVKEVGIDWNKTKEPESSSNSCFDGTFADSSSTNTLLGDLFLKDGTQYKIGATSVESRMGDYIKTLGKFYEDKERVKNILGE